MQERIRAPRIHTGSAMSVSRRLPLATARVCLKSSVSENELMSDYNGKVIEQMARHI
ncbi:hypothetical protein NVV94_12795 [Pseudomonas sp. LS1212]|uniref:hypothetical protein n=1 Tax=Pseudomonas sp. LS1212 TaxID=2972478 RepID=UPI00215C221D|nr:hypothetical protein [Pseudomonas sp. LS1212]UVJ46326.1 hypothetical protein NVV94_12795 [Pseudomonas sp. LS1212]